MYDRKDMNKQPEQSEQQIPFSYWMSVIVYIPIISLISILPLHLVTDLWTQGVAFHILLPLTIFVYIFATGATYYLIAYGGAKFDLAKDRWKFAERFFGYIRLSH